MALVMLSLFYCVHSGGGEKRQEVKVLELRTMAGSRGRRRSRDGWGHGVHVVTCLALYHQAAPVGNVMVVPEPVEDGAGAAWVLPPCTSRNRELTRGLRPR